LVLLTTRKDKSGHAPSRKKQGKENTQKQKTIILPCHHLVR
jgi:hypothetical protein